MPELLTVKQAAEIAGAHRQTLYNAISQGQLRSHKIGVARMIDRRDLEAWNKSRGRWPRKEGASADP